MNWRASEEIFVNALCSSIASMQNVEWVKQLLESVLPWVPVALAIGTAFELLGGLCIFLGFKVRFGAFLLLLFMIPTTFLFHSFWLLQGAERDLTMIVFLKNLAIFGGLLILLALGKGSTRIIQNPIVEKND
jgi:uncharacterized membrane protein YphA (DoxX/SURF4 family)